VESGDYEAARARADESLKIARELEGPLLVVCALDAIAAVARAEGDDDAAQSHLTEAAEIARSEIVPHSYLASVLRGLGELASARGDLTDAEACFEESLSRARGVDDPWAAARAMASQATLADHRNDGHLARALARDALVLQLQIGDQLGAIESLERLASIAIHGDATECGARLLGAAIALREQLGAPLPSWRRRGQQEVEDLARHAVGEERYDASARQGSELSLKNAAAYAAREQ